MTPEYVLAKWTEEKLTLLLRKRGERLERMRPEIAQPGDSGRDTAGVQIGPPDFVRNRVSAERFKQVLGKSPKFHGNSITPKVIQIKHA